MKEPSVFCRLIAIDGTGKEFELKIGLGLPYAISEREWACPITMEGLHANLPDIHGVDAWQALQFAYWVLIQTLDYFVKDGGNLFARNERTPIRPQDLLPRIPNQFEKR